MTLSEVQKIVDYIVMSIFILDFVLNLLTEYKDEETFQMERDLTKIVKRYFFNGNGLIDFIASFPFELIQTGQDGDSITAYFDLLRLARLGRIINLIDEKRINRQLKKLVSHYSLQERMVMQTILMFGYKIILQIVMAIVMTFAVGCIWYRIAVEIDLRQPKEANTFVRSWGFNDVDDQTKVFMACYYSLTTLSTVGFGDMYPVNSAERLFVIFIEIFGMIFFGNIMQSFLTIIAHYNEKMGEPDRTNELQNWLTLLTRFTNNQPLSKKLSE